MGFFDELLSTATKAPKEQKKAEAAPKAVKQEPAKQEKPQPKAEPKEPTAYDKVVEKILEERSMNPKTTTDLMLIAFGNEFMRECEKDKDLAEAYLKKGKTMKEVYDFAVDWARDKQKNGVMFMDTVLFQQCWQQFLDYVPKPKEQAKPAKEEEAPKKPKKEAKPKAQPKKEPKAEAKKEEPKSKQMSIFADWLN